MVVMSQIQEGAVYTRTEENGRNVMLEVERMMCHAVSSVCPSDKVHIVQLCVAVGTYAVTQTPLTGTTGGAGLQPRPDLLR